MEKRNNSTSLKRAWQLVLNAKTRIALLFVLVTIAVTGSSSAFTTDIETSVNNIFTATTLNMELSSSTPDFDPTTPLIPSDSTEREILVQNIGDLPFQYSQAYEYIAGDTALCDALELTVDYQYYSAGPTLNTVNKYTGPLSGFSINTDGSDADFDHPNANPYVSNPEYASDEQWMVYTVTMPASADPSLEDLTCNFNIRANAWQQDFAVYPEGFSDTEVLENTISSGVWYVEPPVFEGWNLEGYSSLGDSPPYLACGATVNGSDRLSGTWTDIAGTNIRYIRHNQRPNGFADILLDGSSVYTLASPSDADDLSYIASTVTSSYPDYYSAWGSFGANQGTYDIQVRAFSDLNSNSRYDLGEPISDWSNYCDITYDATAPAPPLPVITNSPTKSAAEEIVNGSFESGLSDWTTSGDVVATTADVYASPRSGSQMAKVGLSEDPGQAIDLNILTQEIPKGVRSIGFHYNFFSKEDLGIDDPGMMVFVNDKQVQQIWSSDVVGVNEACDGETAYCTGWQYMNVYVGDVEDATLSIAFYAGNTMDELGQSWVYIDDVSTSDVVVNGSALFELDVDQDSGTTIKPYYKIGTDGTAVQGNSFTINSQPTGGIVSYWSEDGAGNKSATQSISVVFDDSAPTSIVDLTATEVVPGEYELDFTAPADSLFQAVSEYEVRYAVGSFDDTVDWNALQIADFVGVSGDYEAPRVAGELDAVIVQNLLAGQQYYFAIKSKDAANNMSAISNIAGVNIGETPLVDLTDSPIVINEYLPNPVGNESVLEKPDGEWVELYNNSNQDIDVVGWFIADGGGHQIAISTYNGDNDLDLSTGETVVPAYGYLVVYDNLYLNNDGDTVSLLNSFEVVIDSSDYDGDVPEGKTIAREYEGVGAFIDPDPTPGRGNIINPSDLNPIVKLFRVDETHAKISIFDAIAYSSADYSVLYTRDTAGAAIKEALQNSIAPIDASRVDINDIYFGTCSSGGVTCVDHLDISDVSVGVELLKSDGTTKTIEYKLEGTW